MMSYLFETNKSKYLMINIQGLLISEKKEGCLNYCDEKSDLACQPTPRNVGKKEKIMMVCSEV